MTHAACSVWRNGAEHKLLVNGVFIKGLEVSSTELVDRTFALRQLEGQRGCGSAEARSWGR